MPSCRAARATETLMVEHGQNAAVAGVDGYRSPVHIAQSVDGGLANDWILAGGHITLGDVRVGKGASGKVLIGTMAYQHHAADLTRLGVDQDNPSFSSNRPRVA